MINTVNMFSLRQQILTAARHLFLSEGLSSISMRRIAADIGVSATAIYRHFRSKDELLDDLAEEGFALLEIFLRRGVQADGSLNGQARAPGDSVQAVVQLTRDYLAFALEHSRYFELMFLKPRKNQRRFPQDFKQKKSKSFLILQELVTACIREEVFRGDDAMDVTLTIWAHLHGLVCLNWLGRFGDRPNRFESIYRGSVSRLLRGLLA